MTPYGAKTTGGKQLRQAKHQDTLTETHTHTHTHTYTHTHTHTHSQSHAKNLSPCPGNIPRGADMAPARSAPTPLRHLEGVVFGAGSASGSGPVLAAPLAVRVTLLPPCALNSRRGCRARTTLCSRTCGAWACPV